jgi:hydrogenase maturation protease
MPSAKPLSGLKKYRVLVLCCGNMDRGDDAVGPLCAAALAERHIPARTVRGDTSELLEAWHSAEHVIVVDAIHGGHATPGTLYLAALGEPAFDARAARCPALAQAVHLAGVLKCLPETLVLAGIEATQFEWASTLSPPVAGALDRLVSAVEARWRELADVHPAIKSRTRSISSGKI